MGTDVAFTQHPNGSLSSLGRAKMHGAYQFLPPPVEQVQRYHTKNLPPPPPDRRLSSVSVLSKEMNVAFADAEDMLSLDADQRETAEKQGKEVSQRVPSTHAYATAPTHSSDNVISPQPKSALPKLWKMTGHDAFRSSVSRDGSIDSTHHMTAAGTYNRSDSQLAPEEVELRRQLQEYEHVRTKGPKNSLTEPWLPSPLSDRDVAYPLHKDVSREPTTAASDTASMDINTALRTLEPEERRPSASSSINMPKSRLGSDAHGFAPPSHIVRRNKPEFPREKKVAPGPSPLKKTPRSAVHDDYAWSRGYRIPDSDDHRSSHDMYHEAAVEMVSKTPPNSPAYISSTTSSSKHIPLEQIIKGLQLTEKNVVDPENASSEPSSWGYSSSYHSTKPLLASPPRPPPPSYHYHLAPRDGQQSQNTRRPSGSSAFSAMSATSAPQKHVHPGDRFVMASASTFGGPSHFHLHPHSPSHSRKPSRSSPSPSPSQKPSPPGDVGKRLGDLDGEVHADGDSSMGGGRRTLSISGTHGTRSIPISRPGSDIVTQTISIDAKSHDPWSSHVFPSPTTPKRHSSIISRVFRRSTGVLPAPLGSPAKQKGPYNQMLEQAQQQRALRQMQHQYGSDVKPNTPTTPTHLSFSAIVSKAGAAATAPFKTPEERRRSKLKNKIKVYGDEGQLLGRDEGATPFKNKTEGANAEATARLSRHSMLAGDNRMKSVHELMGEGTLVPPNDNPIWMGPGVATYVHGTSVSSTPRFVSTPSGTPGVTSARLSAAGTATASGTDSNSVWSRAPTLSATGTPNRTTFGSIAAPPPVTATRGSTSSPPARYHRKTPAGGSDTSHSHSRSPAVGPRLGVTAAEGRYSPASSLPLPPAHIPPPFVPRSFTPQVSVLDNPLKQTRGTSPKPTPSPKPSNTTRSETESPGFSTSAASGAAYGGSGTGAVGLGVIVPSRSKSITEKEEGEKKEGQEKGATEVEGVENVL